MSGLDHLKKVETHFISGEPGTTGREPFEDSTSDRQRTSNVMSGGQGVGHHSGEGLGHNSGERLGEHNNRGIDTATAGSGLRSGEHGHHHDNNVGTGGIATTTGMGEHEKSHFSNDRPTRHTNENEGVRDPFAGDHGRSQDLSAVEPHNRSIVDKVNDMLPGTPKKDHHTSGEREHTHGSHGHQQNNMSYAPGRTGADNHNVGAAGGMAAVGAGGLAGSGAALGHGREHEHGEREHGNMLRQHDHELNKPQVGTGAESTTGLGRKSEHEHGRDHVEGIAAGAPAGSGGATAASRMHEHGHREHNDRVGGLGENSAAYEGGMAGGPRTGGAAGTDRFDSPSGGVGSGLTGRHDDGVHHDTSQRAPGQSSGGIGGALGTSDKDFTGRDRKGEGAYADTDGQFQKNSSGPAGNTALTGREGNLDNNPVRDPNYAHNAHATNAEHGAHGAEHGEKKGFMQKVKDLL